MRKWTVIVAVLLLLSVAIAGPTETGKGPKRWDRVQLKNPVELDIRASLPARLSPDGKSVLYVRRNKKARSYSYHIVGIDGKGDTKVYDSAVRWDDLFMCAFGGGIWSPDGKRFAALTANDAEGREFTRVVLYDVAKKTGTELPCVLGATMGALFDAKGAVYYVDATSMRNRNFRCSLMEYDPTTQKATEVVGFADGVLYGITMSPDRSRIGAILVRPREAGKDYEMCLWAYDIAAGKSAESKPMHFDDYLFDGGPWLFWDADGSALYANGAEEPKDKRELSIVRFEPFPRTKGAKPATTLLQKGKSMLAAGAFAPGKLSVAPAERGKEVKAFVLDAKTDKTVDCNLPLLLIDKCGPAGMFVDLKTRKLCVAQIVFE